MAVLFSIMEIVMSKSFGKYSELKTLPKRNFSEHFHIFHPVQHHRKSSIFAIFNLQYLKTIILTHSVDQTDGVACAVAMIDFR